MAKATGIDKKLVRNWVKALRSGRYKQAKRTLMYGSSLGRGEYSYCCLGVACRVAKVPQKSGVFRFSNDAVNSQRIPEDATLYRRLGLNFELSTRLMQLNDDADRDFDYIAGVIEKEILGKKPSAKKASPKTKKRGK